MKGLFGRVKTSVCGARGNLARLHMRNFRCAFAVWWNFGGFRAYGGTWGAFGSCIVLLGGRFMSFGGRGGRSSFPHFGELGGFCGGIETSVFAFVYIFRSVGGVLSA